MARDIGRRLDSLKTRRTGTGDALDRVMAGDDAVAVTKMVTEETYQKRASREQPYTRYALGSMEEVGAEYTRTSIATAERVRDRLAARLSELGRDMGFRLHGSVACNLHIRRVSDVDLLALDEAFHSYDRAGIRARSGRYKYPIDYTPISALQSLRRQIEEALQSEYPAAKVDTSGAKAVKILGGSLARAVDVVPSHWNDTIDYQRTGKECDRGIYIFDKSANAQLHNMPFRHIKLINERDALAFFGLKQAIRLCKNVKADARDEGTEIFLPSFEIAATMYHADIAALQQGISHDLAILAEAQRHLDALARNTTRAGDLLVPDGSRRIFDTPAKLDGLLKLSIELDELLAQVAREQSKATRRAYMPALSESRKVVAKTYIPFAEDR